MGVGIGALASLGLLMIGRWMRWKTCYCVRVFECGCGGGG